MTTKPPDDLKEYHQTYMTHDEGFKLGSSTKVSILDLRLEDGSPLKHLNPPDRHVKIVALVEFSFETVLAKYQRCETCGAIPPDPNADGLLFLLKHHDGDRLSFPEGEAKSYRYPDRDRYPVPGWEEIAGELTCGECAEALREAAIKVKKARRKE